MNELHKKSKKLNELWLKAAVVGSIWAAFEIIVGSFLHNMHIPFSGAFLAATSIFLLVSFIQKWDEPGVIIRAGLVCALMKSISPSAVILGPMIGIMLEAILLEGLTWIFRRNVVAYMIAGGLAVISTLLQRVLGLLVAFGFDLVAIVKPFYDFLVRLTGLEGLSPKQLITGVLVVYFLIGAAAAFLGYLTGKKYVHSHNSFGNQLDLAERDDTRFVLDDDANGYPFLTIVTILAVMIGAMWLINFDFLPKGLLVGLLFIGFLIAKYKEYLGRLRKPGLWAQFALVTIIAAIFWEWTKTGAYFSMHGLLIGGKMNFRAIIVILGFTAISVELRNPLVRALLTQNGFSSLYASLNLSFSALPAIINTLPSGKDLRQDRKGIVPNLLAQAEVLLSQFETKNKQFDHVYVITGGVHEGKTTFAKSVVTQLQEKNISVAGFLAHGTFSGNRRYSFDLENIQTGEEQLLCIREFREGWDSYGTFSFDPAVLASGNELLKHCYENNIVVIDEVGNFEFRQKKGWFEGLVYLLKHHPETKQIWVVRRDFIPNLLTLFPIPEENIFDIKERLPSDLVSRLEC